MNNKFRKSVICGVFIALFVVLSYVELDLRVMKLTFSSLPVVVAGLVFGPLAGFTVGFLGSFIQQILKYGLMPTTILWMLPVALRGLVVGLIAKKYDYRMNYPQTVVCMVVSSLLVSAANTPVIYLDSKLYGYYSFESVFAGSVARFITGAAVAVILSVIAYPVSKSLRRQI